VVLEPPLPPEFVVARRETFADLLLTKGDVRELGLLLVTQEERMDLLVRVPWAQMGACLDHPDAEDLLNALLDNLSQQQEQQQEREQGQEQQQEREQGQEQQEQGRGQQQRQRESDGAASSVRPTELLPQYAEQLERAHPELMPADWRSLASWRQFEAGLRSHKAASKQAWRALRKQLVQQQLAGAAAGEATGGAAGEAQAAGTAAANGSGGSSSVVGAAEGEQQQAAGEGRAAAAPAGHTAAGHRQQQQQSEQPPQVLPEALRA
jgi:hypothetical protein